MDLMEVSAGITAIVKNIEPSIVRIKGKRGRNSSGVVFDEHTVITSAHNLHGNGKVEIATGNEELLKAEVAGTDRRFDLAALKLDEKLTVPEFNKDDTPEVGNLVFSIGRPGKTVRAAWGMVSVWGKSWQTHFGGKLAFYLETDGSLPRGFSGGALIDGAGRVIGMNTSIPRGMGMTVPYQNLKDSVKLILEGGTVETAYIGVNTIPVSLPRNIADDSRFEGQKSGLMVTQIQENSPADESGILEGDIVIGIEDNRIASIEDLFSVLNQHLPGDEITLLVARSGSVVEEKLTLGKRE